MRSTGCAPPSAGRPATSTPPGLQARIGASSLTLGGLLKHLALVEDYTFTTKLRGGSPGEPWETIYRDDVPDWPFVSAADDTPEQLYALWDGAVARSRERLAAALADGGLDLLADVAWPDGTPGQPAAAGLRPGRGVRPAHRARRPAPRGGGRAGRRGPAERLAVADRLTRP